METKQNRNNDPHRQPQARHSLYRNSAATSPWRRHLKDPNARRTCGMRAASFSGTGLPEISLETVMPWNEIIPWTEPM